MKLIPFVEMLAMTKEKLDAAMAPIRARTEKSRANLEMGKLETKLLEKQREIQEILIAKEIDFPKLMDAMDSEAIIERRIRKYKVVIGQLFPSKNGTAADDSDD